MRLVCKLALALTLLPALMGASVYRWVDENGVVNYTQMKPEGVDAELVSSKTGGRTTRSEAPPAPAGDDGTASGGQPMSDSQKKMLADLRAAEAAREEKVEQIRKANCQRAKEVLQRLSTYGRIRVRDKDGNERAMPEDERQKRISDAQQGVASNCTTTASR